MKRLNNEALRLVRNEMMHLYPMEIAEKLKPLGYVTLRGKDLSSDTVSKWLRQNRVYAKGMERKDRETKEQTPKAPTRRASTPAVSQSVVAAVIASTLCGAHKIAIVQALIKAGASSAHP